MGGTLESIVKGALEAGAEKLSSTKISAESFWGPVKELWSKRGSTTMKQLGAAGEFIVNGLNNYEADARQMSGEHDWAKQKLFGLVDKTNKDALDNYEEYFVGKKQTNDPHLKNLINFERMDNLTAVAKARKAGIPVGQMNPDDFSRTWNRDYFKGESRTIAVKHLVKTGQVKDEAAAERVLDYLAGESRGMKNHNLMTGRKYDLPGYRKDIMSQTDAMHKKLKAIAYARQFGPNGEKMDAYLSAIRKKSYIDYQVASKYVDVFLKRDTKNYRPVGKGEQAVNSAMSAMYLGRTVIKHLAKPLNVLLYTGSPSAVLKGLTDMIVDFGNADEFAVRAGAAMAAAIQESRAMFDREMTLGQSWVTKLTGLNTFDRLSRVFAANAGKHLAQDLAAEYAETGNEKLATKLLQLGIDPESARAGVLTEQQLMKAGQRTSDVTQFVYNPNSLPMTWRDGPYTRMLTQFKPYPYIMGNFIKDHVMKPAMKGDVKPLVYFTLLAPSMGEVIGDLTNLATYGDLTHRPDWDEYKADRIVDNISYIAGFGLLFDIVHAVASPTETALFKFFAGPQISKFVDLAHIPMSAHPDEELMRQIPIVGPLAASRMRDKPARRPSKYSLEGGAITRSIESILGN